MDLFVALAWILSVNFVICEHFKDQSFKTTGCVHEHTHQMLTYCEREKNHIMVPLSHWMFWFPNNLNTHTVPIKKLQIYLYHKSVLDYFKCLPGRLLGWYTNMWILKNNFKYLLQFIMHFLSYLQTNRLFKGLLYKNRNF